MIPEIVSIASAVKSVVEIAKGIKDLAEGKNIPDVAAKSAQFLDTVIDLQVKIIDLQETTTALKTENSELKKKTVQLEQIQHDLEEYRLVELATGVFVYSLDPAKSDGNPAHHLCANCYTQGNKAILQLTAEAIGGDFYLCHACGSEICDHSKKRSLEPAIVSVRRSSVDWKGY